MGSGETVHDGCPSDGLAASPPCGVFAVGVRSPGLGSSGACGQAGEDVGGDVSEGGDDDPGIGFLGWIGEFRRKWDPRFSSVVDQRASCGLAQGAEGPPTPLSMPFRDR